MKKRIVTLCLLLFGALIGLQSCDDEKNIAFDKLPQTARQFIGIYFPDQTVNRTRQEKDNGIVSYEVRLTDGTEIDFLGNGEWKEIDCTPRALPAGLVPSGIARLIEKRFPERKVVKIERDRRDWEVELDDGTDLKFDLQFNLIDIDR